MEAKDLKNIVIKETKVDTVLTKSNLPIAGYSINPYVGCPFGCKYCYAGTIQDICCSNYDPLSPLLCGEVMERDKITPRKVKSIRKEQISLWDE